MSDYPEMSPTRGFAVAADAVDPLAHLKARFNLPTGPDGLPALYFAGHSLGAQPADASVEVGRVLDEWGHLGVKGYFSGTKPWVSYADDLSADLASLVGASANEVVLMNTLTVNLHLMLVSFYRPRNDRFKILIDEHAFPSDRYAIASHARFHGYDPREAIVEIKATGGEDTVKPEYVIETILSHGGQACLVLMSGVNYYTGQRYALSPVVRAAREVDCLVGFDLAHAVGNVPVNLNAADPDFAVWCTYKYLNGGPASPGAAFVNRRHFNDEAMPRFDGWWGHDIGTRFKMPDWFEPADGAKAWQLSNSPVLSSAPLRASMKIFKEADMHRVRRKSMALTAYLEAIIATYLSHRVDLITPSDPEQRGAQLSLRILSSARDAFDALTEVGVVADWREPDAIRVAPAPLYTSFDDVRRLAEAIGQAVGAPITWKDESPST